MTVANLRGSMRRRSALVGDAIGEGEIRVRSSRELRRRRDARLMKSTLLSAFLTAALLPLGLGWVEFTGVALFSS